MAEKYTVAKTFFSKWLFMILIAANSVFKFTSDNCIWMETGSF